MSLNPDVAEFAAIYERGETQVVTTTLIADLETPVSAFLKIAGERANSFLLESVEGGATRGRYSMIGIDPDVIWRCKDGSAEINRRAATDTQTFEPCDEPPLASLRSLVHESRIALPAGSPPMAAGVFGYLGYDMVRQMERLPAAKPDLFGVPDAVFIRPTIMVVFDAVHDEITVVTPVRPQADISASAAYEAARTRIDRVVAALDSALPNMPTEDVFHHPVEPTSNTTPEAYREMVARAKEYIGAGDIFQVVLSQRFDAPFTLPPFSLYRALRRINPAPFLVYFNFGGFSLVCSSPEILVRLRDDTVTIRPIAGTRRRGASPHEDKALEEELLADPKERAEHLMLLDLGRNDVGRVAQIGSVKVTDSFFVERYSQVMHIVSNVEGSIDNRFDALDALAAGFPAGTVSGAPKVRAMEIIDELEHDKRGIYAGAIGYFGADGEMDTCIVLRTAVVKDGKMHVQAGAGIVYDSVPENELQECVNKAKALFRAGEEAVKFAARAGRGQ